MSSGSAPERLDIPEHLGVLRRYALVLTRDPDEAEDLVQEALLRAVGAAHTWQPGRPVRPWLLAILHNTHVSRRRRRQVEAACAADLARALPDAAPAPQPARVELGRTVRALLALPEEQREALVLVALEGLAYKDAAELLGVPLGTLMSRLGRGREALRRAVGEGGREVPDGRQPPKLRVVR
jgi:RNA polymerase sigma-70 factor (ECF subfamily)